jgi:hypothetical protein
VKFSQKIPKLNLDTATLKELTLSCTSNSPQGGYVQVKSGNFLNVLCRLHDEDNDCDETDDVLYCVLIKWIKFTEEETISLQQGKSQEALLTLYRRCGNCLGTPGCLQPDEPMQSGAKRELCSAKLWKPSAKFNSRTLSCNGVVLLNSDGMVGNTNLLFVEYSSSKYSTALVPRPANPSEPSRRI